MEFAVASAEFGSCGDQFSFMKPEEFEFESKHLLTYLHATPKYISEILTFRQKNLFILSFPNINVQKILPNCERN